MLLIVVTSAPLDTTGINHVGISCIMQYNVAHVYVYHYAM